MTEEKDNLTEEKESGLDWFDVLPWALLLLLFISVCVYLSLDIYYKNRVDEKDCVEYYEEHGYILKACDKYEDKLLKLELKAVDAEE